MYWSNIFKSMGLKNNERFQVDKGDYSNEEIYINRFSIGLRVGAVRL